MTVTLASCQHCGPISIYGSQGLWSHGQSVSPLPLDLSLLTSPASCLAMCYSLTHTLSHSSLCLWIWHSPVTDEPHPTFSTWPLSCLRKSHVSVVTLNPQEIHQHPSASSPAPPLLFLYCELCPIFRRMCECLFTAWRRPQKPPLRERSRTVLLQRTLLGPLDSPPRPPPSSDS